MRAGICFYFIYNTQDYKNKKKLYASSNDYCTSVLKVHQYPVLVPWLNNKKKNYK